MRRAAKVFRELGPVIEGMLSAIEEAAAYLDEHRDMIAFRGGSPVVSDPAARAELAALMEAAGKTAQASEEGKRKAARNGGRQIAERPGTKSCVFPTFSLKVRDLDTI